MPKALFAVYTDAPEPCAPSAPLASTSRAVRPRRALESDGLGFDKENGDAPAAAVRPKKATAKSAPVHFAGKTPFALASPVACSKDAAQQRLGLGIASGNTSVRGPRPTGGKTARSVGLSVGRKRGRQVSEELALETLEAEASEDSAIVDEDADRTLVDLATSRDGALAVVTQAYTGQGAFCYSPTAAVRSWHTWTR